MIRHRYFFACTSAGVVALLAVQALAKDPPNPGKEQRDPAQASAQTGQAVGQPGPAGKVQDHPKANGSERNRMDAPKEKAEGDKADKANPTNLAAEHAGHGHGSRGALRELAEEIRSGKVKKADVQERLASLDKDRNERKLHRQSDLRSRWGQDLAKPATLQELRHHSRRMAFLNRMLVVAQTERTGKAQEGLVTRVETLILKEEARHDKKMTQLKLSPGTQADTDSPAAAASSAAQPAPQGATPPSALPAAPSDKVEGDKK